MSTVSHNGPKRTIEATYENGVFKPRTPIDLPSGTEVRIVLPDTRDAMQIMNERMPNSFGTMSDEDAAEMIRLIEEEFEQIGDDD
jgi:predicted DNA-binding antitoxin AbrB/MazE fold protein